MSQSRENVQTDRSMDRRMDGRTDGQTEGQTDPILQDPSGRGQGYNYQMKTVSFNYSESHEGKSRSVIIGSIFKCSFTRGMLKSQKAARNIDGTLAVIQNESKQSTKKTDLFTVEKVGWFRKRLANLREYCKIGPIMTLHFFTFNGHKIIHKI